MNIQLIQGQFSPAEALELITAMIHIKVAYHENKIQGNSSEEDIKFRESRIKNLQKDLYELKRSILQHQENVKLDATITVDA